MSSEQLGTARVFTELAGIAAAQRGLYPALPGPELRAAARDAIGVLDLAAADVRVERTWTDGDLHGEELSWTVGFGPRTRAYLLKPRDADGPLPGVVALHCHAGMKYAGKEKIADGPEPPSPEVRRLRDAIYGGRAFANALARRGFVVLAHDVLTWGSRRFPLEIAEGPPAAAQRGDAPGAPLSETGAAPSGETGAAPSGETGAAPSGETGAAPSGETGAVVLSEADRYDAAAKAHEHVVAKYCTVLGTSFTGVVAGEDLAAAAYLRSRPDVGAVGCAGLSGGGLRAALLGAFDPDQRAVVVAAMASSYRDLLDRHVPRHTWMLWPPGLARLGDWPDLMAARAPGPLMVQYALRDELFPEEGMRRAHAIIGERYRDAPESYAAVFAEVPHSFDVPMQERAFDWLAAQLRE
ncbi:acetylesterase [Nonomuraea sp. FMUSA5-5]|uniref:Acetylesterase n=1 Tax=Nonomuraea composti TaxID=2720023 RepID=A0ABX1AYN4_9ACTN|nr:acetylesterase [Nonomuraea sp. FMUSA5-5]NJP89450.1 acetylesterase [Nonomuraea sp. FMUSA5-5]